MDRKAFHDIVSVFENFSSEPKDVPLIKWLAACKKGGKFKEHVLRYRETGAQEIKKGLPLITPGGRCVGGRRKEHVVERTGWLCIDIDDKDNPQIQDAEKLRDEIFKISNIAFAALSTGGKGVWGLVKVADPDNQEAHFQALLNDFDRFGIKLDSSKGKNANDARFYSFDPNARIKQNFEIYTKKYTQRREPRPITRHVKSRSSYGEKALQQEIGKLAMAREGTRNETLFKCAASLFELVAGGELEKFEAESLLHETARSIGLTDAEIQNTLASAKKTGLSNPRSAKKKSIPHSYNNAKKRAPYPPSWDTVPSPPPGSPEDREAEYYAAMDADEILTDIVQTFDAELV